MAIEHVWAFEWLECIFESDFRVVSIHRSSKSAYKVMRTMLLKEWTDEWESMKYPQYPTLKIEGVRHRTIAWMPLHHKRWRVRKIKVED